MRRIFGKIFLLLFLICLLGGCGKDIKKGVNEEVDKNLDDNYETTQDIVDEDEKIEKSDLEYVESEDEYQIKLTDEQVKNLKKASFLILEYYDEDRYIPIMNEEELEVDEENIIHIKKNQKVYGIYIEKDDEYFPIYGMKKIENSKKWATLNIFYEDIDSYEKLDLALVINPEKEIDNEDLEYTMKVLAEKTILPRKIEIAKEYWMFQMRSTLWQVSYDAENRVMPNSTWTCYAYRDEIFEDDRGIENFHIRLMELSAYNREFKAQLSLEFKDDTTEATDLMTLQEGEKTEEYTVTVETEAGTMEFSISENEATLTKYKGEDAVVEIPSKIEEIPVTKIARNIFYNCEFLEKICIPETVNEIGANLFSGCDLLTEISIDSQNENFIIENQVLLTADKKKILWVPRNLAGEYIIPEGIEEIGGGAFAYIPQLTSVVFPDSLKIIHGEAFWQTYLSNINIPDSVEYIGGGAFGWNYPKNKKMEETPVVNIGKNVKWIGEEAFSGICIRNFEVDSENPYYSSEDGMIYNKEKTFLCQCPVGKNGSVTIPEGVEVIESAAFANNGTFQDVVEDSFGITELILPDSLTTFDSQNLPKNLKKLSVGSGVENWKGIYYCRELELEISRENPYYLMEDSVIYDADKTKIYVSTVENTKTTYTIPETVTSIETSAFSSRDCLEEVRISSGQCLCDMKYEDVGKCFKNLSNLKEITVEEGNEKYSSSDGVLMNKEQTILLCYPGYKVETEYSIPEGVTTIKGDNFNDITAIDQWDIMDVYIPNSLKNISEESFQNSTKILLHIGDNPYAIEFAEKYAINFVQETNP